MVNCSIETLMKLLNVIVGEADIAAPLGGGAGGGTPPSCAWGRGGSPPENF